MSDSKKPYQSKTLWVAAVVAIAALIPGVGDFVKANVELTGLILGGVFALLRVVTKGQLSIE